MNSKIYSAPSSVHRAMKALRIARHEYSIGQAEDGYFAMLPEPEVCPVDAPDVTLEAMQRLQTPEVEETEIPETPPVAEICHPPARSTAQSPTNLVWKIADSMPDATRRVVVDFYIARGIAKGTAATQ